MMKNFREVEHHDENDHDRTSFNPFQLQCVLSTTALQLRTYVEDPDSKAEIMRLATFYNMNILRVGNN